MSSDLGSRFSKRRRIAIIVTLGLLTGLGPFTIDLYLPAFPSLKGDLGITDAQVQVTLSATTLGFAIGQLVIGPWSDRIGRRVPLMVASSLHVAASVLVAVAPNVEFLTAMRALQGIGAAGGASASSSGEISTARLRMSFCSTHSAWPNCAASRSTRCRRTSWCGCCPSSTCTRSTPWPCACKPAPIRWLACAMRWHLSPLWRLLLPLPRHGLRPIRLPQRLHPPSAAAAPVHPPVPPPRRRTTVLPT